MILFLPVGVWHRLKARTGEKLDRMQEGLPILITLRLMGLAAMTGVITYLVSPACMAWSAVSLPVAIRWIGVGIGLFAGLLIVWTFRTLGGNLTDTVVTRKTHTLVTSGPYRWVRHPFYVAVVLFVIASSLIAANWFIFATGSTVFTLQAIRARKEEANLVARFGEDYRIYQGRTGRFLPRWTEK